MGKSSELYDLRHPEYDFDSLDWEKWRLTYEGGTNFRDRYLVRLSNREDDTEFANRKEVSYVPSFAKAAVNDVKNSIFQRTIDIVRKDGPKSYIDACSGLYGGVDYRGSSMNSYIGRYILPELLTMRKVGVFVDMPKLNPHSTLIDNVNARPYIYMYQIEDILCWEWEGPDRPNEYSKLLLKDHVALHDGEYGLSTGQGVRYRYLWKENGKVYFKFCYPEVKESPAYEDDPIELNLSRIPFHVFEIPTSLLKDIADIQIALMNIASSDIAYIRKANYPIYVEPFDPRTEFPFHKPVDVSGEAAYNVAKNPELVTGTGHGRRYPAGFDAPSFIHPSSEPIKASMEKQEALKKDIKELINLAVSNLNASAESKQQDLQGLEAGLSFIGLVLETGERQIAEFWATYLGEKPAHIAYPTNYSLKSEGELHKDAESVEKLMSKVPSDTFKREMAKEIARKMLGGKVSQPVLDKIYKELETAPAIVSDPDQIHQDWEDGLVSTSTASKLRGYDADEVAQAKKDHAERIKLVLQAQGGDGGQARGAKDFQTSKEEKLGKPRRGEGKKIDG